MSRDGKVTASINVRNIGKVAGETVVQLYVRDVAASMARPVKELKHFRKLMLKPGESQTLTFDIVEDDLKFYNQQLVRAAEAGQFTVMIGLDSEDVKEASFELL